MTFNKNLLIAWIWFGCECTFNAGAIPEGVDEGSIFVHLHENVAASNKFAVDENLRYCWPTAEIFDALSELFIQEHIVGVIIVNSMHSEDLYDGIAETTAGSLWITLKWQKLFNCTLNLWNFRSLSWKSQLCSFLSFPLKIWHLMQIYCTGWSTGDDF